MYMNSAKNLFLLSLLFISSSTVSNDISKEISLKKISFKQRRSLYGKNKKEKLLINRAARNHKPWFRNRPPSKHRLTYVLGSFVEDAININLGLFSWDSLKIFVTTAPFFVGARMIDEKLQNCFFDHSRKKNKNDPPQWCKEIARLSIGIPIALLSTQAVLSRDDNMRITSQVFLTGMPFVLLAKDLIKTLDLDVCKRPFHEKFAKHNRCLGGFPSGHLAEATYMAVLYGLRFGPNFAIPLGSIAFFVGSVFLASNRHYLSQMIAGAAFGAMYAFSANRLIESKLAKKRNLQLGLSTNESGGPMIHLSFKF